jgi:hypothetical protein
MLFSEAFAKLGYSLDNPRQDWSAEKMGGICLTLWSKETDWKALVMDTRIHAKQLASWRDKPGNKKRIRHAKLALAGFDGWIDVVKLDGEPGVSFGNASPWLPSERMGKRWRVTYVDEATGHIRLEVQDYQKP